MSDAYASLFKGYLGSSLSTLFSGSGTGVIVKHWSAYNSSSGVVSFQTFNTGFATIPPTTFYGSGSAEWDGTVSLGSSDTFQASATVSGVVSFVIDGDATS